MMTAQNKHTDDFNKYWESEIAAYDAECKKHETDFLKKHMVVPESGLKELDDAENEVLRLVLQGLTCEKIARETDTETEMVKGVLEIIRAKLALDD